MSVRKHEAANRDHALCSNTSFFLVSLDPHALCPPQRESATKWNWLTLPVDGTTAIVRV